MDKRAWLATWGHRVRHDWMTKHRPAQSVQFSCSVVSDSLWPHGLQPARLPCPSPTPGACSNSCPLSQWCHLTFSSSVVPFFFCLQSFPASVFSNESALHIRLPRYWNLSFSISPSNEYSGLIFFRIDWFDSLQSKGRGIFTNTTGQKHQSHSKNIQVWCKNSHILNLICTSFSVFEVQIILTSTVKGAGVIGKHHYSCWSSTCYYSKCNRGGETSRTERPSSLWKI